MKEREIAVFALMDIVLENAYNNIVLRKILGANDNLDTVQKAFITQLVNGTLRNLIHMDYVISQFSKTPVKKMKPLILNTLRTGVYQIMFMDKVPDSAACNEAVKIVKAHGFKSLGGFVNGVLRNVARNKNNIKYPDKGSNEFLSVRYSYPKWIIDYWLEDHSFDDVYNMCQSNDKPPKITICVNTLKTTKGELCDILKSEGVETDVNTNLENSIYISKTSNISKLESYKKGLYHIMDESSMLAVKILSPKENSTVIDVCAAPGGKSFCCGYLMNNKGEIISRDIYEHKVRLIDEGAKRLGVSIIKPQVKDALEKDSIKADYVIVDAPCSGLGLVRKKPDIKYNKSIEDIDDLSKIQRDILKNAASMVNDKGILLYSTCTISHKENIDNVKWFCKEFDFEPINIEQFIPKGVEFETAKDGYIEIAPHKINSDGFFIAKMRKK